MIVQVGSWQELNDELSTDSTWHSELIDDLDGTWMDRLAALSDVDVVAAGYLGADLSDSDVLALASAGIGLSVVRVGDGHTIARSLLDGVSDAGMHCYLVVPLEGLDSEPAQLVVDAKDWDPASSGSTEPQELVLVGESTHSRFSATLRSFLGELSISLGEALATERAATEEAKGGVRRRRDRIAELDAAIQGRDQRLAQLDAAVAARDERIAELESAVARRDERIAAVEAGISDRDGRIASMAEMVEEAASKSDELELLQRRYDEESNNRESMRTETVNLRLDLSRARRMLSIASVIAAVLALATLALALT